MKHILIHVKEFVRSFAGVDSGGGGGAQGWGDEGGRSGVHDGASPRLIGEPTGELGGRCEEGGGGGPSRSAVHETEVTVVSGRRDAREHRWG